MRLTVNQDVVGSSPTPGAKNYIQYVAVLELADNTHLECVLGRGMGSNPISNTSRGLNTDFVSFNYHWLDISMVWICGISGKASLKK